MTRAQTSATSAAGPPRTSRRRRWLWVVAGVLVVLVGVTLVWFQPQKLFYDQRVDEGLPSTGEQSKAPGPGAAGPSARPMELASGSFVSGEHETHGAARVLLLPDGRVVVRFEDFATSNGPVLVVRLSTNPAQGGNDAFDDDYVDLGPLKGNIGDQNYLVPVNVDVTAYASVVVWCDRFHVSFGAADLVPST